MLCFAETRASKTKSLGARLAGNKGLNVNEILTENKMFVRAYACACQSFACIPASACWLASA